MEVNGSGQIEGTLCFFVRDYRVLLAWKTRNIAEGTLNGYGGGREGNESFEECCAREVFDECGIRVKKEYLRQFGIVYFHNQRPDGEFFIVKVIVFVAVKWEGEPKESVEMASPRWYSIHELPIRDMMPGDRFWFPEIMVKAKKIIAHVWQNLVQKKLLRPVEIREVESFSEND